MEPEFESAEELTNFLIENKALELHGMTEDGEITYKFDFDVLENLFPKLYNLIMDDVNDSVLELYKLGYVDMEYDENLEAKFKVNEKGKEYLKQHRDELDLFGWE